MSNKRGLVYIKVQHITVHYTILLALITNIMGSYHNLLFMFGTGNKHTGLSYHNLLFMLNILNVYSTT